jgi:hypothetical protein
MRSKLYLFSEFSACNSTDRGCGDKFDNIWELSLERSTIRWGCMGDGMITTGWTGRKGAGFSRRHTLRYLEERARGGLQGLGMAGIKGPVMRARPCRI